uniref:DUF6598 domain-containing protein n=2 Tax=Leersia perrieri TaxID=77586 RepID=A0A0D9X439_9ORYZ
MEKGGKVKKRFGVNMGGEGAKIGLGSPIHSTPYSRFWMLESSVNVIAIKVAESDVGYHISIFGTVLMSDRQDYRCVYLFRHTLTLTGPKRGLASNGSMYIEFNLKIKGDVGADKDFSKGFLEHSAVAHEKPLMTLELESFMSTVAFIYTPVPCAVQATLALNFLEGLTNFTGKGQTIVMSDGHVALARNIVAVHCNDELVLQVSVFDGGNEVDTDEECIRKTGPYVLQDKVGWTGIIARRREIWERVGRFGNILW